MDSLEITFAVVGIVGFVFVLITLIFGEIFDLGDDFDTDVDTGVGDLPTPSLFSSRVIAAALVGFGAFGFLAAYGGASAFTASLVAIAGFVVVGGGVFYLVVKPLARQQYNATISQQTYIGLQAQVVLPISKESFGQVEFIDNNHTKVTRTALSSSGGTYATGTVVTIVDVTASAVVVE